MRTSDDAATWTELHLAADGLGGEAYRTSPLDNQWELCDLTADAIEADNRWTDPGLHELRQHLRMQLKEAHATSVPDRNQPWPYAVRRPPTAERSQCVLPPCDSFVACSADSATSKSKSRLSLVAGHAPCAH